MTSKNPDFSHDIIQREITQKRYKIELYFSQSGSQTILVFPYQTSWQYFDSPSNGCVNVAVEGTNRDRRDIAAYRSMT